MTMNKSEETSFSRVSDYVPLLARADEVIE
jgi:hypothetical protein